MRPSDAAVLEAAARVGRAAGQARSGSRGCRGSGFPLLSTLREKSPRRSSAVGTRPCRSVAGSLRRWNSWLQKKNSFFLSVVERAGDVDRPAQRVAVVVARGLGLLDEPSVAHRRRGGGPLVRPAVRVPVRPPAVPVARAVEGLGAALGHDLDLAAHRAPVFGLVGVGEDLELGHRVDVGGGHVAAVVAGVDVGHAVDRHVVRVRPLPVHGEGAHLRRSRRPRARSGPRPAPGSRS